MAWIAPALLAAVALGASSSSSAPAPDASWLAFGNDAQITGSTPAPAFTTKVKGFKLAWQAKLDGGVMASPLAAPVAGQGLVVFATTAKGNVYAVKPNGTVLWQRSLGTVVADGNCGTYGINSTGAIDAKHGLLYVVGATGMLHALRLADGSDAAGWPVRVRDPHAERVHLGRPAPRRRPPLRARAPRTATPRIAAACPQKAGSSRTTPTRREPRPSRSTRCRAPNNLGGRRGAGAASQSTTAGDALYTRRRQCRARHRQRLQRQHGRAHARPLRGRRLRPARERGARPGHRSRRGAGSLPAAGLSGASRPRT